jgi:hypothetical protein
VGVAESCSCRHDRGGDILDTRLKKGIRYSRGVRSVVVGGFAAVIVLQVANVPT